MISMEDCIALCGLNEKEVMAIAEHEHIPEIAAAAMGRYLLKKPGGPGKIREMMRDDFKEAIARGDREPASEMVMVFAISSTPIPKRVEDQQPLMSPLVEAFFEKRTSSVQYLVADPATRQCAIIDPVLESKHGKAAWRRKRPRTSTAKGRYRRSVRAPARAARQDVAPARTNAPRPAGQHQRRHASGRRRQGKAVPAHSA